MAIQNYYRELTEKIDTSFLMRETEKLWRKEFPQTYQAYHNAAKYAKELLEKEGIPNVEMLEFPADGKSAFLDVRMPIAWDASIGRLTLQNAEGECGSWLFGGKGPEITVADYQKHPFSLVKGSVLADKKKKVRIITEKILAEGADATGTLIVMDEGNFPGPKPLSKFLDAGAIGFISDAVTGAKEHPDSIAWFNAATEDGEWHVTASHRPFVGFSVTPRLGAFIRENAEERELFALAECDGRRYEGVHHVVTALIPGRQKKEVWAYAHLYEPLSDDDSCGVAAIVETAKQIMREGIPEYSVRVVFAMELYGYAAYIGSIGGNIRERVIGGCNFDAMACVKDVTLMCFSGSGGIPFFGNYILEELIDIQKQGPTSFQIENKGSAYFDDISFSCPSVGFPAVWPISKHGDNHHTSRQEIDIIDPQTFTEGTAFNGAMTFMLANPSEKMFDGAFEIAKKKVTILLSSIRKQPFGSDLKRFDYCCGILRSHLADFGEVVPCLNPSAKLAEFDNFCSEAGAGLQDTVEVCGKWRTIAAQIRMRYTAVGFPHSLVKAGDHVMFSLPDNCIYGIFANVIANLHTEMSLAEAIRKAEYEKGVELSDEVFKEHVDALIRLATCGYLEITQCPDAFRNNSCQK